MSKYEIALTNDEDSWWVSTAVDLKRMMKARCKIYEFIDLAMPFFYRAFPQRHPRTYLYSCETLEETRRAFGEYQIGSIREKIRHKLNNLLAKAPANSSSGLIDTVRARTLYDASLGYRVFAALSPYSIDTTNSHYDSVNMMRMALWLQPDYACATNDERASAARDIPFDMRTALTTLSKHTGAEFYMIGAWRDENDEAKYFDATSDMSATLGTLCAEGLENWRQTFLEFQTEAIGRHKPRNHISIANTDAGCRGNLRRETAGPAVYGRFDGSFWPWIPRWTGHWAGLVVLLKEYLVLVRAWQNISLAIPYVGDVNTPSDLVSGARLPDGWSGLPEPGSMTEDQIYRFYHYIRAGQLGQLPAENVFQFNTSSSTASEATYEQCLVPPGEVRYGPGARLFVRRLLLGGAEDRYARAESLDHLPPVPQVGSVTRIFEGNEYELLRARLDHHA
ncbi:hypothetical protein BDV93DRAFT_592782, partial [Ceratobasidium sp. AG-I]